MRIVVAPSVNTGTTAARLGIRGRRVDRGELCRYIVSMMDPTYENLIVWFLYFSVAAAFGWVIESTFRSVTEHHWVNSGFLSGPFIPIYGFGALALAALARALASAHWALFWPLLVVTPSIVEYVSSYLLEKAFGLRLWDYSKEPLNLRGRVCFVFSMYWAMLTVLTVRLVEPFLLSHIRALDEYTRVYVAGALSMYFVMDTIGSSKALFNFKAFAADLRALVERGGSFLPTLEFDTKRLPREIRRLVKPLKSFPTLVAELRPSLDAIPGWITSKLESIIGGRHFRK